MAYVLLNSDNTVNFIGDSLVGIDQTDLKVLNYTSRTIESLLNNVQPEFAVWDKVNNVVRDVRKFPELLNDGRNPAERVRYARDIKLADLDELVKNPLRYGTFTEEQKTKLAVYRQALLDIPQQGGFPVRVDWPQLSGFMPRS